MMDTVDERSKPIKAEHCSACKAAVIRRPYFRMDKGCFCNGCLAHYSIHELQARIGRNKLHGCLYF